MTDAALVAFCWFQENEWQALKKVVPLSMDDSYDEWLKNANDAISDLRDQGIVVKKIAARADDLIAWCHAKGIEPDSPARSEYAVFKLQQRGT